MKYLRYSNLKLCFDLNPFSWGFKWTFHTDSAFKILYFRIIFLSVTVVIDNGSEYVFMGLTSDVSKDINMGNAAMEDER